MKRPLKLRALLECLREAQSHGCDPWPTGREPSLSRPVPMERAAAYHAGAERESAPGLGAWLAGRHSEGLAYYDWCASSQGWAEMRAALPGESLPPWRAGSYSEIWRADALSQRRGEVLTIEHVRAGRGWPTPGALALFRRGGGAGHVERVIMAGVDDYLSVGGNEAPRNRWQVEWRGYEDRDLVGFCECDPVSDADLFWIGEQIAALRDSGMWTTGIDVSHHQHPQHFDWGRIASEHDFAIIRATHSDQTDRHVDMHQRAASLVDVFGAYSWLDETESLGSQLQAMIGVMTDVLDEGDMVPAVDVEAKAGPINPEWWRVALPTVIQAVRSQFGGDPYVYGNSSDLERLGDGPWCDCPLWIAHHTMAARPREPKNWRVPWSIWQHAGDTHPTVPGGRTGGYADGTRDIDMNRAREIVRIPG